MKKTILFVAIVFFAMQMQAQNNVTWIKTSPEEITRLEKIRPDSYSQNQQLYRVELNDLKKILVNATDKFSGNPGVELSFPNLNGSFDKYLVWENSNFEQELQAKYPEIRAYVGKGVSDKSATINFSLSPEGIQTMVLKANNESEFLEPYTKDNSIYVLFDSKTRVKGRLPFNCSTKDEFANNDFLNKSNETGKSSDQTYRTARLALSCTGEYAQYYGGTVVKALAAMNATMTRVNGVYEKDLALHLNIIANNELVVYTTPSTDPYSPASQLSNWQNQLQATLTSVLGNGAYDIGHLFGATGGGGNSGCIGCICVDDGTTPDGQQTKGRGYTSPADGIPGGANFDIDYVSHEMGHQLGAQHTFSYQLENLNVQVEPGSGSTIMGYAGITDYNVQDHSDPYFTYKSILQIQVNLDSKTCLTTVPTTNKAPKANAGLDYKIPSGTAYLLKGSATDADGDALSYCWEQNDPIQNNDVTGANSEASPSKLTGPNFRSFSPVSTPNRYMPEFYNVYYGALSTEWESVSTVARSLKFVLTVRDNNPSWPQTSSDEMIVTSATPYNATSAPTGAGPFTVTSQSGSGITWSEGSSQAITWNVNNTTSLVGSANVNIKLSINDGVSFDYILASNTPNDGNENITVPKTPYTSSTCRILIEPTGNIYYAINSKSFKVESSLSNGDFNLTNFSLYPNPNKGSFTVKFDSNTSNEIGIVIHDLRGRSVFEHKYTNNGLFNENINLNAIQSGIYIITVKDGDKQVVKKMFIE